MVLGSFVLLCQNPLLLATAIQKNVKTRKALALIATLSRATAWRLARVALLNVISSSPARVISLRQGMKPRGRSILAPALVEAAGNLPRRRSDHSARRHSLARTRISARVTARHLRALQVTLTVLQASSASRTGLSRMLTLALLLIS